MAFPKRKLIADCSHLPYTLDDALRICRTGQLDYFQTFARTQSASGFYLADLTGRPVLSWPPELPNHDPRGNPSVPNFEHWKKAQDSKIGIAGNYFSFKGGGMVPCHSSLEHRHLSCFEMNPFIVEIRAQYPEWRRSLYQQLKGVHMRMPKRSLMTIDFVLTLQIPGNTDLRYHAVSIKPYELLTQPAVVRRHKREAEVLAEWGCTHEIMTGHTIGPNEAINSQRLLQYMRYVEDISLHRTEALDLSNIISRDRALKTCDEKIEIAANSLGWSRDKAYRIFAVANFLGYLSLDHAYELLPNSPLHLR
jgi:hypothetical protein